MSDLIHRSAGDLIDELIRRGWREEDLPALGRILRVPEACAQAEKLPKNSESIGLDEVVCALYRLGLLKDEVGVTENSISLDLFDRVEKSVAEFDE